MSQVQLVRYKKGKRQFEIMTHPGSVLKYREGKMNLDQVLMVEEVFKNQHKGDVANNVEMKEVFGTENVKDVCKIIVEQGELQVSAAERKEAVQKKRKEIVSYIHKNYINPQGNLPHPVVRIESALDDCKGFHVDPNVSASDQVEVLIKKLQGILTFKKSEMEGTLTVEMKYMGQVAGIVHKVSSVYREKQHQNKYSWEVGISPSNFDNFTAAINKVTKGDHQFPVAGQPAANAASTESAAAGKKGKKGKKSKKAKKNHGRHGQGPL